MPQVYTYIHIPLNKAIEVKQHMYGVCMYSVLYHGHSQ